MNIQDLYEQRNDVFYSPSSVAKGAVVFCLLAGIGALIAGILLKGNVLTRFWGGYLLSVFFFYSVALGGVAFSAMQDVIGALWGRPIKRLHESFGGFLPVATILFLLFFLSIKTRIGGAHTIYPWIVNPESIAHYNGKNFWLRPDFMIARDSVALIIVLLLALWQGKHNIGRDLLLLAGKLSEATKSGEQSRDKLRYWSAPILIVYSVCYSLLGFDLLMSLAPTWFSTLWGGWLFSIMMQTLMATLLLFMFAFKNSSLGSFYKRQHFHDIGKLMHGFTIFYAYLTYSHVLTYWYGNMPEETEYFIHRLHQPWLTILLISIFASFVFPLFALIPKVSKWTQGLTVPIAVLILIAQFLAYVIVVTAQIVPVTEWKEPSIEIGMFLGILGLFLMSVFWFGKQFPMIPIADPLLVKSLKQEGH